MKWRLSEDRTEPMPIEKRYKLISKTAYKLILQMKIKESTVKGWSYILAYLHKLL